MAQGRGPAPVRPSRPRSTPRAAEIVAAARRVLETEGAGALTMRRLGTETGMRAPSLYKHFSDKASVESALVEEGLANFGERLHAAVGAAGPTGGVRALLGAYRTLALEHPNLYRLATVGPLDRSRLTPGLEEWAGEPFFVVTGDPSVAQALWSCAHGMVILELDGRYPAGSDLSSTWSAAADAFGALGARGALAEARRVGQSSGRGPRQGARP